KLSVQRSGERTGARSNGRSGPVRVERVGILRHARERSGVVPRLLSDEVAGRDGSRGYDESPAFEWGSGPGAPRRELAILRLGLPFGATLRVRAGEPGQ